MTSALVAMDAGQKFMTSGGVVTSGGRDETLSKRDKGEETLLGVTLHSAH